MNKLEPTVSEPYDLLYSEEERRMLKTQRIREEILDNKIATDGIPTKSGDIRVLNELMDSIDSSTFKNVDLRLKNTENNINEDLSENIKDIFTRVDKRKSIPKSENILTLESRYNPNDIVDGELTIDYAELTIDDLKKGT